LLIAEIVLLIAEIVDLLIALLVPEDIILLIRHVIVHLNLIVER